MDRRSDPFSALSHFPGSRTPASSALECAEFRAILTGLSRELCSPLVALRAGIDALLSERDASASCEQNGHLRAMVGLCDDLIHLTRGYLGSTSGDRGSRPCHFGNYTLSAVVHDLDQEFAPQAEARGIHWDCRLDGPDGVIRTDASRCQELFGRLIANVLRSTPEEGLLAAVIRLDGSSWCLSVVRSCADAETEPADRGLVGSHRSCAERTASDDPALSLALCRALAAELNGRIEVASDRGRNVSMTVRLPTDGGVRPAARI